MFLGPFLSWASQMTLSVKLITTLYLSALYFRLIDREMIDMSFSFFIVLEDGNLSYNENNKIKLNEGNLPALYKLSCDANPEGIYRTGWNEFP